MKHYLEGMWVEHVRGSRGKLYQELNKHLWSLEAQLVNLPSN